MHKYNIEMEDKHMSSIKTNSYKVALFVGGLGSDGSFFDPTITKLKIFGSSFVVEYPTIVKMNDFNTEKDRFYGVKNGYLTQSSEALTEFNEKIAEIVQLSKDNPNKTVLVRTKLDYSIKGLDENNNIKYISYESIADQSKKLKYIINAIKNLDSSINIILIGHSQGGLVNLETAIDIPQKIAEVVSISTPYSPVSFAQVASFFDAIHSVFNTSIYEVIYNDVDVMHRYDARVTTLASSTYFNNLKQKWNDLSYRPDLTVIAGVSGHIMTSFYIFPFEVNFRYPFDGLVLGKEQVEIDHCTLHVLHNDNVACYEESDGFQHSCCSQFGLINYHNCQCPLPCFDISAALHLSAFAEVANLFRQGNFIALEELPLVQAINEAIDGVPLTNQQYRSYYETIAGQYSHLKIREADKTVLLLLGKMIS